jgi:alpha-L-fucosidase 2
MDVVLIQDALEHAIRAAERLEVDADRRQTWQSILDRLPPLKVGRHGQLQEWNEDFDEVEPGHRHFSHMIGLYPGDQLDPERTPALWTAAKRALERRLAHSGGHTGWSRSWTACMFARLGDAGKAWEHLAHLITDFATDSLLDLHPPRIFQIDGNFGGTAAVLEMLLQSYREELHFLPALPAAWKSGQVRGVRARGGFTVGLEWRDERLARAEIVSCRTRVCTIRFGAGQYTVRTGAGKNTKCSVKGQHLCFNARRGQLYIVAPLEARNG